jgi:hypothetical protein
MNGRASSGFNDVVLSFKWQLLVSYGFILAAVGGLAFPFIRLASAVDARSTKYSKRRKSHKVAILVVAVAASRLIEASCFARPIPNAKGVACRLL